MKILLGDFNAMLWREGILKRTIVNDSLNHNSNYNCVRIIDFATSKNLVVKGTIFPHRNIGKYTWTTLDGKTHIHGSRIDR
jgi:hypothetical protein